MAGAIVVVVVVVDASILGPRDVTRTRSPRGHVVAAVEIGMLERPGEPGVRFRSTSHAISVKSGDAEGMGWKAAKNRKRPPGASENLRPRL